jgi:hypothetical protein
MYWAVPEVYGAFITGTLAKFRDPSMKTWSIRLAVDAGLTEPYPIPKPVIPVDAPPLMRTIAEGVWLVFACKWTYEAEKASMLGQAFLGGWCGGIPAGSLGFNFRPNACQNSPGMRSADGGCKPRHNFLSAGGEFTRPYLVDTSSTNPKAAQRWEKALGVLESRETVFWPTCSGHPKVYGGCYHAHPEQGNKCYIKETLVEMERVFSVCTGLSPLRVCSACSGLSPIVEVPACKEPS